MQMPPLHNRVFGGEAEGKEWVGRFVFLPTSSTWAFKYLVNYNPETVVETTMSDEYHDELIGYASTPRDAFEDCLKRFISLNANQESPTLKAILPSLREFFTEEGGVKLEHFFV